MNKYFLDSLIKTPSPSGDEIAVQKKMKAYMSSFADEIRTDASGNVIGIINPDADFKVLLAGHSDEIAWMVSHITGEGYLNVVKCGGIQASLALGMRVRIYTSSGIINGIVGVQAAHHGGSKGEVKPSSLFIDCGFANKEEAAKQVTIGDYVLYDMDSMDLQNGRYAGRALDNRSGAFIISQVLKELSVRRPKVGVYAVSTVNEETNAGGAYFAASQIKPNVAIACDVTFATDYPGNNPAEICEVKLGGGPVLAKGSMINKKANEWLAKAAKDNDVNIQLELTPRSTGTDADKMRFTGEGTTVCLVSLPLRYMHSSSEVVDLKDIEEEIKLLVEAILALEGNESFKPL